MMLLFTLGMLISTKKYKKLNYFDVENKFVWVFSFEKCEDLEWCVKVSGNSIIHQHKLSFRWWHFQGFIKHKLSIIYAFMKIAIIKYNISRCVTVSHRDILAENKFKTGIVSQVAFHLYWSINWTVDNISTCIEQDVNSFK